MLWKRCEIQAFFRVFRMKRLILPVAVAVAFLCVDSTAGAPAAMRFRADFRAQAEGRQAEIREKLYALMMWGRQPEHVGLDVKILRRNEISAGIMCWKS
jgi:hypothetical protein